VAGEDVSLRGGGGVALALQVGKNVWIFGGEDKNRNVLDEVR
jgi:hypothetical protein